MVTVTLTDYWMGRDKIYPQYCDDAVRRNAQETVRRANLLLASMAIDGVALDAHPNNQTLLASGWRPAPINAGVKGAAPRSKHMTGEAIDLYDPEGELDDWCMAHEAKLAELGLYLEHPAATKGWCHVQTVPPRSGNRVFYP